ncbi:MAG: hypothetical protein CVT88_06305 [Candidatus Altiarchaeales archaeon HGW-Altiarchaeales-1]|nr:MAG: hypothetical protein CVT88_06305 [Candidatus Altiarchaeales archaeon HGW-Altiarchaeales-1]
MKSLKKYIILIAIFFIILAGIILYTQIGKQGSSDFMNFSQNISNDTSQESETQIIIGKNIEFSTTKTNTLENLPYTSKPKFKIGEKYTYQARNTGPSNKIVEDLRKRPGTIIYDYMTYPITFSVEKIERINKTDYYLISTEGSGEVILGVIKDKEGMQRPFTTTKFHLTKYYINTENGEILFKEGGDPIGFLRIYEPRMLKLSEGLKWQERSETNATNEQTINEESCEVKDVEEINGKKCFKVECRVKQCKNEECKVVYRKLYWVDMEKRLTLKFQLWYENLQTMDVSLINYEK